MNKKVILVSNGVAQQLLSFAAGLKMEVSQQTLALVGTPEFDSTVNNFQITHTHAEHGPQRLNADRVCNTLFVVSFVGRTEYFEKIHTDGWSSSIQTLFEYLESSMEIDPEFRTPDKLKWVVMTDDDQFDDGYLIFITPEEDAANIVGDDSEVRRLLMVDEVDQDFAGVIDCAMESFEAYVEKQPEVLADAPIDQNEVETEPGFAQKFKHQCAKFFNSPVGRAATVCFAVAAVVGIGYRFLKPDVVPEI